MFKFAVPRQTIAKYARDKKGNPVGLVCAFRAQNEDGTSKVVIGWSCAAKCDKFNKNVAWATACGRAIHGTKAQMPGKLAPIMKEIRERAERYFK
jgi:hypothetical protein